MQSRLVKIGERIINLDQIAFAERKDDDGTEVVTLFYEAGKFWLTPDGEPVYEETKEDPRIFPLNMSFRGADARFVWEKLATVAEVWALPSEIEPDAGESKWRGTK